MTPRSLGQSTMLAVAKRIARLHAAGNSKEATRQYLAHLSEMNAAERAAFENAIVTFRMEVER